MKIKTYLLTFGLIASSIISTYFVTVSTAQQGTQSQTVATADNEYQVGAILFMQKAAEFRALCYQAFNLAQMNLDADFDRKNVKKLPKAERKMTRAVVVDIDETVLDNSPHQADLIKKRLPFTPTIWTDWVNRRMAKPIPGAVEFLKYASSKGVRVFYVSNRNESEKQGTIDNLKAVGFPDVSGETVLVRTSESGKEARRQIISAKYRIVLLMGDNLNDLSNVFERKSVDDRFAEVDKTREMFGRKFIVLPNAMYGDWESAIYEYRRLNEVEKTAKRANTLESY
ncbi:MAG: 5'-nucleotidase, lipoprotein e(P4) family [Acidobacteria bacterium]|jgi:5'-nucleotidase (lipoprotein e(P4) family)|nr:5'-nucleotidase, lipoprotein e(P4) family [Acidobacteriota bacterium]